jgi:hypothetical protein
VGSIKSFFTSVVGLAKRQPVMFAIGVTLLVVFAGGIIVKGYNAIRARVPQLPAPKVS